MPRSRPVTPYRRPGRQPDRRADWLDLVGAILDGTPALPGAACRHRPALFDPDSGDPDNAARLCQTCPVLDPCRRWAERQPAGQLCGVVAARLYGFDSRREVTA